MEENINALDEINKGATMGMDAIHFILDKVEDDNFKKILDKQYKDYENISEKIKATVTITAISNDDTNAHICSNLW